MTPYHSLTNNLSLKGISSFMASLFLLSQLNFFCLIKASISIKTCPSSKEGLKVLFGRKTNDNLVAMEKIWWYFQFEFYLQVRNSVRWHISIFINVNPCLHKFLLREWHVISEIWSLSIFSLNKRSKKKSRLSILL